MQNIISDIKSGDVEAFREFFNDYYVVLCVFAARFLQSDEQCKDVAQEALTEYWEKREDFDELYKVKGYLYTVTRNRCLNILRHEKAGRECLDVREANLESEVAFENLVIEQETYLLVRKAVDALPPRMRTIIYGMLDGKKNARIAEEMGIGEGTVKALKQTAYRKLREQLKEHFYLLLLF